MKETRRVLLAAMMVALILAAGYALAAVPNVELVTVLVFVTGFLLGPRAGAGTGAVAWGLHSLFNPLGAALPPILAVQVFHGAVVGFAGGALGPRLIRVVNPLLSAALLGLVGLALSLGFQLLINAASFLVFIDERALGAFWKYLLAGLAFTMMHLVWNTGVFLVILRPVLNVLDRHRPELKP
jgi:hypothetical protein